MERQQICATAVTTPGELKELPGFSRTHAMARIERQLHEGLRQSNTKPEDREDLVVRLLAQSHLETLSKPID